MSDFIAQAVSTVPDRWGKEGWLLVLDELGGEGKRKEA